MSSHYICFEGHESDLPLSATVNELMRAQLEMAENFMHAQRRLYQTYCRCLEEAIQREEENKPKVRYKPKSH